VRWGRRLGLILAILIPGVFSAPLPAHATTYYVDVTNGNNSWSGTSSNYVSGTNGPWLNFTRINRGGKNQLQPGDVVYAMAGVMDHSNDSISNCLYIMPLTGQTLAGTSNNPITISNYPGAYFTISNSGPNNCAIVVEHVSWFRIFGINETNAFQAVGIAYCTNCEVAYCNFGGGNTNYGFSQPFFMYNWSQSNWIHNNTVHDALANPCADSTHNLTIGQFYSTNDLTSFNILESNICYHAGHDALSCYGPSNVLRNNFIHNENWFFRRDLNSMAAHRCMEVGGTLGYGNLVEGNRAQYAGYDYNTPHGLELDGPGTSIIRNNVFSDNGYSGLTIYGCKVVNTNFYWGSNCVYNNTIAKNGFGTNSAVRYTTNAASPTVWVPYVTNNVANWLPAITLWTTTNNLFVNNLLWGNWSNAIAGADETTNIGVALYASNLVFNALTLMFLDTNDGGAWSQTQPDYALRFGSKAIDAGTWLTTITSASGSGASFTVANPNFFFAGMTAASRTLPGDTLQLQGQTTTATITSISGNTITVNAPLTWTNGQGLALAYSGAAPDVGAYEYIAATASAPNPPTNLRIVTTPQ
jgi:hypothetical protein